MLYSDSIEWSCLDDRKCLLPYIIKLYTFMCWFQIVVDFLDWCCTESHNHTLDVSLSGFISKTDLG